MHNTSSLPARLSIPAYLAVLEQASAKKTAQPYYVTCLQSCISGPLDSGDWMQAYDAEGKALSKQEIMQSVKAGDFQALNMAFFRLKDIALAHHQKNLEVFYWCNETGELIVEECLPHLEIVNITYRPALDILSEAISIDGYKVTPEALLWWVTFDKIKAVDSELADAEIINTGELLTTLIEEKRDSFIMLLAGLYFSEDELRKLELDPLLSYLQVVQRWKKCGLSEHEIEGILGAEFCVGWLEIQSLKMLGADRTSGKYTDKDKLERVHSALYPLSDLQRKEKLHRIFPLSSTEPLPQTAHEGHQDEESQHHEENPVIDEARPAPKPEPAPPSAVESPQIGLEIATPGGAASSPEPTPPIAHEDRQGEEPQPDGQNPAIAETEPTATPLSIVESPQQSPDVAQLNTSSGTVTGKPPTQKQRKALLLYATWQKVESACQNMKEPIAINDIPGTKKEFYELVKWLEPELESIKKLSTFDGEYLEPGGYRFPRKMKEGEYLWEKIFPNFSKNKAIQNQ